MTQAPLNLWHNTEDEIVVGHVNVECCAFEENLGLFPTVGQAIRAEVNHASYLKKHHGRKR